MDDLTLPEWLAKEHVSRSDFADRIDVSPTTVTNWCNGHTLPRRQQFARVREATAGEVTMDSFLRISKVPRHPHTGVEREGEAA